MLLTPHECPVPISSGQVLQTGFWGEELSRTKEGRAPLGSVSVAGPPSLWVTHIPSHPLCSTELLGDSLSPLVPVGAIPRTPPTANPPILACSRPSSHPALRASARMATDTLLTHETCAHAHTRRVTDAGIRFLAYFPSQRFQRPRVSVALCLQSLCLGGAGCCFSAGFRFQFSWNLSPHRPTRWSWAGDAPCSSLGKQACGRGLGQGIPLSSCLV